MSLNTVYFSLGTNMGNRLSNFMNALNYLNFKGINVTGISHVYESNSWGYISKNSFLNLVVKSDTTLTPDQLMQFIMNNELSTLRERNMHNYSDRTVDIDILFFNSDIIVRNNICVPHPLFHLRSFCARPMADIHPGFIHPVLHMSIHDICEKLTDDLILFSDRETFSHLIELNNADTL